MGALWAKRKWSFMKKCISTRIRFGKAEGCGNTEQEFRAAKVSLVP